MRPQKTLFSIVVTGSVMGNATDLGAGWATAAGQVTVKAKGTALKAQPQQGRTSWRVCGIFAKLFNTNLWFFICWLSRTWLNSGWRYSPQETGGTHQWGGFNCWHDDRVRNIRFPVGSLREDRFNRDEFCDMDGVRIFIPFR